MEWWSLRWKRRAATNNPASECARPQRTCQRPNPLVHLSPQQLQQRRGAADSAAPRAVVAAQQHQAGVWRVDRDGGQGGHEVAEVGGLGLRL